MKKILCAKIITCILTLLCWNSYAQAPNISYPPSAFSFTAGTAITPMTPQNTGGPVPVGLSFGTAKPLTTPAGTLVNPYGMGVDPSGNLYVTDFGSDAISEFSYNSATKTYSYLWDYSRGYKLTQKNKPPTAMAWIAGPAAIGFDQSGKAYTLNYNPQNSGNQSGDSYVTQTGSDGKMITEIVPGLGSATGMAMDLSNNLYVAESNNKNTPQIERYTTNGTLSLTIPGTNPLGVATDGSGNIYMLDNISPTTTVVKKYNSAGVFASTLISGLGSKAHSIYADGAGDVYIGDSGNGPGTATATVTVYDPAGNQLTQITGLNDPRGMVTDKYGNLFISDYSQNTVTEYPIVGGYYIDKLLPPGLSFDVKTGTFSGTPSAGFPATLYTVTCYNASGSSSTTLTISCTATLAIDYGANTVNVFTTGTAITALTPVITAPNGSTYTISISPALPTGLGISTTGSAPTAVISGSPADTSALTAYTVTIKTATLTATTVISIATVKDNYWKGTTSIDWNTASNWSANKVPTAIDYASIGVQPYTGLKLEPTISSTEQMNLSYLTFGKNHAAATLTVQSGGSLTIGKVLTVSNASLPTLTGAGNINIGSKAFVDISGTGALTIQSPLVFTLMSDATGSASVSEITSGSITGLVSVQRYMSAVRGYRLMASPVNASTVGSNYVCSINYIKNSAYVTGTTGTATTGPGGFDKQGNPTLYIYRESAASSNASFTSGSFRGINNLNAAPAYTLDVDGGPYYIPVSNGFLFYYRGSRRQKTLAQLTTAGAAATTDTLTATGNLNQGSITFRNWYTSTVPSLDYSNTNPGIVGLNAVGNPYASTIDLTTINTSDPTSGIYAPGTAPFIYELDPISQNYQVYDLGLKLGINNASQYIASGQGFFVQALNGSAQLIFNESAKISSQTPSATILMGKPIATANFKMIRLVLATDATNRDEVLVVFKDDASTKYLPNEDASTKSGSGVVSLASISSDNQSLSINKLPLSNGLSIALRVAGSAQGKYSLSLKEVKALPKIYAIWLMDRFTKDSVNLRLDSSYSFYKTADTASYGANRFRLVIKEDPALAYQLLTFDAQKTATKTVQLTWTTKNEDNYTHFTVERSNDNGKSFQVIGGLTSTGAGQYSLIDPSPLTGDNQYRLQQINFNNDTTYSAIVDVQIPDNGNSSVVSCYPNPASSIINLTIIPKSPAKATYDIKISNTTGLIIKSITISGDTWTNNISDLMMGTYLIQVTDKKDNSLVGQTKFVKL